MFVRNMFKGQAKNIWINQNPSNPSLTQYLSDLVGMLVFTGYLNSVKDVYTVFGYGLFQCVIEYGSQQCTFARGTGRYKVNKKEL